MIFKVFSCIAENKEEIIQEASDRGIVFFQDTNKIAQNIYQEHLKKGLSKSVHFLYTNNITKQYDCEKSS